MYANLPAGSTLANEHWDDWLPIGGLDGKPSYGEKAIQVGRDGQLRRRHARKAGPDGRQPVQADYIVLSSNRLYDSIPRLPIRYPMTTRYYQLLFSGSWASSRSQLHLVSTPLGIEIPDQVAEESFSVYDHPRVQIFRKTAAFDPEACARPQPRHRLGRGHPPHPPGPKAPDGLH